MTERPVPVTRTETLLCLLIDEVAGLRADLAGRDGAPVPVSDATSPAPETTAPPAPPALAAKTTAAKRTNRR